MSIENQLSERENVISTLSAPVLTAQFLTAANEKVNRLFGNDGANVVPIPLEGVIIDNGIEVVHEILVQCL